MQVNSSAPRGWTNMAGIGKCYPRQEHYPKNISEIKTILQKLKQTGERCRVVGGGKSPNTCTFTDAHLIHMNYLNKIISVNTEKQQIICEGGALLKDIFNKLSEHNLMLRCVPSYVFTTIAGAIGTATHGSGIHTKCLSDYVAEIILIDGNGEIHKFDSIKTPKELSLVACHLGMLGVIVQVTLQAEKKQTWCVRSSPIKLEKLIHAETLKTRVMNSEFYRFFWMPNTEFCFESIGKCVEIENNNNNNNTKEIMEYKKWKKDQKACKTRIIKKIKGNWLRHNVVEAALATSTYYPKLQPYINRTYRRIFYAAPEIQYGTPLECFTFDCLFKQWACEWAIDAEKTLEAFTLLRELIKSQNLSVHFPVEFRFTDADSTALSPGFGRKTCWIGIVMYRPYLKLAPDTLNYYKSFSEKMTAIGGRPHWAKYYTWGPAQLQKSYGNNWEEFLELRKVMDPNNMFINGWWKSLSGQGPLINSTISHL